MPFLIPTKRSSISKSMRFSKYKNIEESQYFQLQKRKSSKEPGETSASVVGRWQTKSSKRPTYRIITKGHPYYEVAYDFDLDQIKLREWNYIINELPRHLPGYLSQSARTKWLLAHFTQLALETDGAQPQIESDDDDDDNGKTVTKTGKTVTTNGSNAIPGSPFTGGSSSATSPMTISGTSGAVSSSSMSSLSLGSTASMTASPARAAPPSSTASSSASLGRPPLPSSGAIGRPAGGAGTIHATAVASSTNGFGNLSSDDDKSRSRSTRNNPSSSSTSSSVSSSISSSSIVAGTSLSSSSSSSSRVKRASDGSGSPFTAPPLSVATPPGARFSLRGRRAFWILLLLTNCLVVLLRDASISSCILIILLLDLLLYSSIVRGEPVAFTIFVTRGHPTVTSVPVESASSSSSSSRSHSSKSKALTSSSRQSPSHGPVEDVHAARFAPGSGPHMVHAAPSSLSSSSTTTTGGVIPSTTVASVQEEGVRSVSNDESKGHRADNDNKGSDSDNEGDQGSDEADRDDGDDKDGASPISTPIARANPSVAPVAAPLSGNGITSSSSGMTRIPIGQTVGKIAESTPMVGNTGKTTGWCSVDGTSFQVRLPGYKIHKKKGNSAPALYDIFASDAFRCPDRKVDNIMKLCKMPPIPPHLWPAGWTPPSDGIMRDDGKDWPDCSINGVPPLIVIHFQIPEYQPANPVWGKGREDGEGYSMIMYFWLTEYGKQEAIANRSPAIKLFQEFLRRDGDVDFRNRFKCIARVQNPDDCNLGSMLKSTLRRYNAKPWLTGPLCHDFVKGFNYMEADIDVHRFSYFGRQAAAGFLPQLQHFVFDLAFTVEGQDDRELPEQVLCACRLFKLVPTQAKTIGYYQDQERKEQLERDRNATGNTSAAAASSTGAAAATTSSSSSTTASSSLVSPLTSPSSSNSISSIASPPATPSAAKPSNAA